MSRALYIGAGTDILPVIMYPSIKDFYYIESQPTSEFGILGFDDNKFYRKNFLSNLSNVMYNNNFKIREEKDNYLRYYNPATEQNIHYYINTPITSNLSNNIISVINSCNILICIGHDPHNSILQHIQKPFMFIGSTHTVYSSNSELYENPSESTFLKLHSDNSLVSEYQLIKEKKYYEYWKHDKITNKLISNFDIVKFTNLEELNTVVRSVFEDYYAD